MKHIKHKFLWILAIAMILFLALGFTYKGDKILQPGEYERDYGGFTGQNWYMTRTYTCAWCKYPWFYVSRDEKWVYPNWCERNIEIGFPLCSYHDITITFLQKSDYNSWSINECLENLWK